MKSVEHIAGIIADWGEYDLVKIRDLANRVNRGEGWTFEIAGENGVTTRRAFVVLTPAGLEKAITIAAQLLNIL